MYTESSEEKVPAWAKIMIEGLVKMNGLLADTVKGLQDRQDRIEAKLNGKPEKEKSASEKVTPEQIKDVCEKLYI